MVEETADDLDVFRPDETDKSLTNVSVMTDDNGALCCPRCNCKLKVSGGPVQAYAPMGQNADISDHGRGVAQSWYKVTVDLTRKRKRNGTADPRTYQRDYMRRYRARLKAEKAATRAPA